MNTLMNALPLTDTRGQVLLSSTALAEPLPGSVVLTNGEHGTAWQRFFSDGRWHPTRGGGSRSWEQLLTQRNLVLVYDAPRREDDRPVIFKRNKSGDVYGPAEELAKVSHAHTDDGRCIKNRNGKLCVGDQR